MRRLLAIASALLMATVLTVGGGASPAIATPSHSDIDVKVWAYICDDEVIDRRDNCGEHERKSTEGPLKVPGTVLWHACQGHEVWVNVDLRAKPVAGGKVEVKAWLTFLEAAFGCNVDIEDEQKRTIVINDGERAVMNFVWGKAEKGHDGAVVQVILNDKT